MRGAFQMSTVQKKVFTSKLYREKTGAKAEQRLLELRKAQLEISSKITGALKESPKTVPEISKVVGMDSQTVLWYLSTYLKYNLVTPVEKTEDGYFKYGLKKKE